MKSIITLLTAFLTLLNLNPLLAAEENSLVGDWSGTPEGGSAGTVYLKFNEDGTGLFRVGRGSFEVEYTEDRSVTPHRLKFTGKPPGAPEPQDMHTIYEFVDADTVKMAEPAPKPPESYDEGAPLIAKRVDPDSVVSAPAEVAKKMVGKWIGFENGDPDDPIMLEFREDGSGTMQEGNSSEPFTYEAQGDSAPYGLTLDMEGQVASTIFEFQDDNTLKIDEPGTSTPDGTFSEDVILFERMEEVGGDPKELIVGTWAMGDRAVLTLNEDGTGTLVEGEKELPLQYEITTTEEPLQLDLTIEDTSKYSLVEFLSQDRIRITEPQTELPESMGQAGVFERQEE